MTKKGEVMDAFVLKKDYNAVLALKCAVMLRFECAVGGIRHPQHTQTSSNSCTIAADNSFGVTNTRCCRYSCLRS